MKYLCMVFLDESKLDALSKTDAEALNRDSLGYDETLRQKGSFVAAQALQRARTARTVRRRNGKVSITNGPFAETTEQIGGFLMLEAASMEEAVALASRVPVLKLADIEIRPVRELKTAAPAEEREAM